MNLEGIMPEAMRNVRIQLRPRRMLAALLIALGGSVTLYVSYLSSANNPLGLLEFLVVAEVTVLAVGGGIYCLQSIHREKELNTFDYQRITRLTPLELTLGKLFGAPSLMYFIVLCLLPVTLVAAYLSGISPAIFLAAFIVALLGSIALHSLALLVSALSGRGSSAGAIIGFLIMVLILTSLGSAPRGSLVLGSLSPYFAERLVEAGDGRDLLLGHPVPHVPILIVLYLFFAGWFLLGLVRIIKRDPSAYEVYSPRQALCFVLSLDLIVILFFNWNQSVLAYDIRERPYRVPIGAGQALSEFLAVSLVLFALLGLALLRNRERMRRRISSLGAKASGGWAALWPAPYLLGGFLGTGLVMTAIIEQKLSAASDWSLGMAVFEVCFVALWIARDALYLQWMNLRRGRRPLWTGLIYLAVFYACAGMLYARLDLGRAAMTYLLPWTVFGLDAGLWGGPAGVWIGALVALGAEAAVFALLQRAALARLRESTILPA